MNLLSKFLTLSRGKQISLGVCLFHFLAIFALTAHHIISRQLKPERPMIVRTLKEQTLPKTLTRETIKEPQKTVVAAQKKAIVKASQKRGASLITKKPFEKQEKLLEEIAANLETLKNETVKSRKELNLPQKVLAKTEAPSSKVDPSSGEMMIAFLQSELDLPEYGDVKLRIEVDRFGRLVDCEILESKSAKNAQFLKNRLPELAFPWLNETQSFTITFRNVEIP